MARRRREGTRVPEAKVARFYHVGAARLTTVEWPVEVGLGQFEGHFVRLVMPAGASGEERDAARDRLLTYGRARVVRLGPAAGGAARVPDQAEPAPAQAHRSARQVVEKVVEEVPTQDRDALRAEVEVAMSEVGL